MTMFVTVLLGLLSLDVLVVFHEFGHLLVARFFGVKVEAFSVGMGPVLLHKTALGIDWRLSLLPVGGYCAMKGEKDYQRALEAELPGIEAEADNFYGIHPLKRLAIAMAGPAANLLFSVIASAAVAMAGYTYYSYSAKIRVGTDMEPPVPSSAAEAGIRTGDTITAVNGAPVENFSDLLELIGTKPGKTALITVERDGKTLDFKVPIILDKEAASGKIGVGLFDPNEEAREFRSRRHAPLPAVWQGIRETGRTISLTFTGFRILLSGVNVTKTMAGPAQITTLLGQTARSGPVHALNLMALISVSLFVMNLLPVPVLDGGLCLFALIEAATRRKLNPRILYYIQGAGLFVLAALMVLAVGVDILHFAEK